MTLKKEHPKKTTVITMDAKRIREIREAEGLTQEDFAEKICIDKQTV